MIDIKKIIEYCIESELCATLGQLYNIYLIQELKYSHLEGSIFGKSEEAFSELKRLIPIWNEKYGFNDDTELKEILKKI